jgi:hypothetical protein
MNSKALERRRQQNRVAQFAFRERSKKQMEELQRELAQCIDFNQKVQNNVKVLLKRADHLKRDIEAILAVKMPVTSLEVSRSERRNILESGNPESETSLIVKDEASTTV